MSHISGVTVSKLKQPRESYETSFNAKSSVLTLPEPIFSWFQVFPSRRHAQVSLSSTCWHDKLFAPADNGGHGYPLEVKGNFKLFLDSNLVFPAHLSCPGTRMECSGKAVCPCTSPLSMDITKAKASHISPRLLPVQAAQSLHLRNTLRVDDLVFEQLVRLNVSKKDGEMNKRHQFPACPIQSTSLSRVRVNIYGNESGKKII